MSSKISYFLIGVLFGLIIFKVTGLNNKQEDKMNLILNQIKEMQLYNRGLPIDNQINLNREEFINNIAQKILEELNNSSKHDLIPPPSLEQITNLHNAESYQDTRPEELSNNVEAKISHHLSNTHWNPHDIDSFNTEILTLSVEEQFEANRILAVHINNGEIIIEE